MAVIKHCHIYKVTAEWKKIEGKGRAWQVLFNQMQWVNQRQWVKHIMEINLAHCWWAHFWTGWFVMRKHCGIQDCNWLTCVMVFRKWTAARKNKELFSEIVALNELVWKLRVCNLVQRLGWRPKSRNLKEWVLAYQLGKNVLIVRSKIWNRLFF